MLRQFYLGLIGCALGLLMSSMAYSATPIALETPTTRLLPLAACVDCLGAKMTTAETDGTVTVIRGNRTITVKPNEQQMTVDGKAITTDAPAMVYQNVLYVPEKTISQGLGAEIKWDSDKRTVSVYPDDGDVLYCPIAGQVMVAVGDYNGDGQDETAYAISKDPLADDTNDTIASKAHLWMVRGTQTLWQSDIGEPGDTVVVEHLLAKDFTGDRQPELIIATTMVVAYAGPIDIQIIHWNGTTFHNVIANDTGYLETMGSGGVGDVLIQSGAAGKASSLIVYNTTAYRAERSPIAAEWYTWTGTQFKRTTRKQTKKAYDYFDNKEIAKALKELAIVGAPLFLSTVPPVTPSTATNTQVQGLVVNNGTMVPLRAIAEWLEATVGYEAATRFIGIDTPSGTIGLTLDSPRATIGVKNCTLSVPPVERNGITYVPLRFVAEAFLATVTWNEATQQATIVHPNSGETMTVTVIPAPKPMSKSKPTSGEVRNQLLVALKALGAQEIVRSAQVYTYNGKSYGVMYIEVTGEAADTTPAYISIFRYDATRKSWVENHDILGGDALDSLIIDTKKVSKKWGVPKATIESWIRMANKSAGQ